MAESKVDVELHADPVAASITYGLSPSRGTLLNFNPTGFTLSPSRATSFHITQKDLNSLPDSIDLPESIYGAAMMAALRSSQTYHKTVHGVTICVFAGLAINVLMQFYVLYCTKLYICIPAVKKVRQLYAQYHEEVFIDGVFSHDAWESFDRAESLCQVPLSQPMFFLAILMIWTATCWVDLSESVHYLRLWCNLKQPGHCHSTEVEFCDEQETFLTTAASRQTKALVVALVLVPKVMIAIYLWLLGARWLTATTSFQDLMLNAVALAFITELDELIYMVVVPEDIQALVRMYKIVRHDQPRRAHSTLQDVADLQTISNDRDRKFKIRIARMLGVMFILIAVPVAYMYGFQHVLPGYRWDVHAPCEARIADLMGLAQ